MSLAFLFPGQGSQCLGMGAELFSQFPAKVEEASSVLGYSLAELCIEGPENKLNQTQFYSACSLLRFIYGGTS